MYVPFLSRPCPSHRKWQSVDDGYWVMLRNTTCRMPLLDSLQLSSLVAVSHPCPKVLRDDPSLSFTPGTEPPGPALVLKPPYLGKLVAGGSISTRSVLSRCWRYCVLSFTRLGHLYPYFALRSLFFKLRPITFSAPALILAAPRSSLPYTLVHCPIYLGILPFLFHTLWPANCSFIVLWCGCVVAPKESLWGLCACPRRRGSSCPGDRH